MSERTVLGVIGGSGVYAMEGLAHVREERIASPWGEPSDALRFGILDGVDVVFLARHGRGHRLSPTDINYRANIDALKRAGVTDLISLSACGSLKEDLAPGAFVLVDQFIDRTYARDKSFFGAGFVAHVSMAQPVCPKLVDALEQAARTQAIPYRRGGTYHGRPAIFIAGGIAALPRVGLRRDRHDQHAGSQARTRGGAALRERRHGDGL